MVKDGGGVCCVGMMNKDVLVDSISDSGFGGWVEAGRAVLVLVFNFGD